MPWAMGDLRFAYAPSTIRLGDLEVCRLGFGAMRLPGKDVWGEPANPEGARDVLRRAIELGMNLIDTAWYYGPLVANRLIVEALYPYPRDLVIATKLGGKRLDDKGWAAAARPEELRTGCETDLSTLRLERLDVVHMRYIASSGVAFTESLDALIELKKEGKIRHLALSNVSTREVNAALERTPIVAVQNLYNVTGGSGQLARRTGGEVEDPEAVLELCTANGIAFLPYFPLGIGNVDKMRPALAEIARKCGATPMQVALAWLLARSPVMLPIPGTSSVAHLEENWVSHRIALDLTDREILGRLTGGV